jgi:hypothetical protein
MVRRSQLCRTTRHKAIEGGTNLTFLTGYRRTTFTLLPPPPSDASSATGVLRNAAKSRYVFTEKNPLTFSHSNLGKLLSRYERMET